MSVIFSQFTNFGSQFVQDYGLVGLGLFSFTEAFINPLPVSPLMAGATLLGLPLWPAFFVTFFANILGGVIGYYLGKWLGHPIAVKLFGKRSVDKAEKFFAKWGALGVFIGALTFLPFKVAAWAAGIFEMRFSTYLYASALGRALYFLLVLAAVHLGWEFVTYIIGKD